MDHNTTRMITNLLGNASEAGNDTSIYPPSPIGPAYFSAYNIYLYLMMVLGVPGNMMVLAVFSFYRPSTTTDWYILSITICDFISSSVNVPVYSTFTNGYWSIYGTTLICRLHMFLSQSIVLSSSFLICGLALDRYLKICRRLSRYTSARARNVCVLITAVTSILSTPAFAMFENREGRCEPIIMNAMLFAYYLMVFMIFICATVVVVFSYCKVTNTVKNIETNVSRNTGHTETVESTRVAGSMPPLASIFFRGKFITLYEDTSSTGYVNMERNKDNLQMERPIEMDISSQEHIQSISGRIEDKLSAKRRLRPGFHTRLRKSERLTKISFLVCSVFILSWLPSWLCFVLAAIPGMKANVNVLKFMLFGKMTYLLNGVLNPVIYTWMNNEFRNRMLRIFCYPKL